MNTLKETYLKNIFKEIITHFTIPMNDITFNGYQQQVRVIHNRIPPRTHYRNIYKLAPIVLYMYLKDKGSSFQKKEFLRLLELDKEDFNKGLKRILPLYPQYQVRDRMKLVINKLKRLQEQYKLSSEFLKYCEVVFHIYAPSIMYSTEASLTGFLAVIAVVLLKREKIRFLHICKSAGTTIGGVSNMIKRVLFSNDDASEFKGIKASRDLIKAKVMEKIDIKDVTPHAMTTAKQLASLSDKDKQRIFLLSTRGLTTDQISKREKISPHTIRMLLKFFEEKDISLPPPPKAQQYKNKMPQSQAKTSYLSENPFPKYGKILTITKLPTPCHNCGNPLLKLEYKNNKEVFFCKYCYKK